MYASLKSITTWPPSRENARRFTLLLCTASALGSLLSYGVSAPMSLGLLLINVAAAGCVWTQHRLSRKSIKFQPQELADRDGSMIPFARTRAERMAVDDLRDSLEERYGNREGYVAKVEAAAAALVEERLLLPQDAAAFVAAASRCDRF